MHPQISTVERGKAIADVILGYPVLGTLEQHIKYACALADLGVHVVVTPPGVRSPDGDFRTTEQRAEDEAAGLRKGGWYLGTTNKARLTDYINRAHYLHAGTLPGLGIHLAPSRIIIVDADNEGDCVEWNLYQDHRCREDGVLPEANPFTELSPGKLENGAWTHRYGAHCWYLLPDTLDPHSLRTVSEKAVIGHIADDSKYPRAGWEFKVGNLGALITPSVRPEGAYRPGQQGAIPVAPQWLIELLTKPAPAVKPAPTGDDIEFSESVDDALSSVSWGDILEGVALEDGQDTDGCTIFTRPGGSRRSMIAHDGCSSVNGSQCLTVHSDTILTMYPLLQDLSMKRGGKSFSKWEALAAFQHNGDMNAVARERGFSRPSSLAAADWDGVFVDPSRPFTAPLTAPVGDRCSHGIPVKLCVPCLAARIEKGH